MRNTDKELDKAANRMFKGKAPKAESKKSTPKGRGGKFVSAKEPTDAIGWLKKAYIDNDPKDGAPKVGDIGYV